MIESEFIEAIRQDSVSDAPRLIYADWLNESGDPRGEFITIQCEIARRSEFECGDLERREKSLLDKHKANWTSQLREIGCQQIRFTRGFVDQFEAYIDQFAVYEEIMHANAPLLSGIEIRARETENPLDDWRQALKSQTVRQAKRLMIRDRFDLCFDIWDNVTEDVFWDALFDAGPNLQVRNLILNSLNLESPILTVIAQRSHTMSRLEMLQLADNQAGNVDLERFLESRVFQQLALLNLQMNNISNPLAEEVREQYGERVSL